MKRNARSLDLISDSINKLERGSIFDIGDLLVQAKGQCDHGQWLTWLSLEFSWSVDTAERYMRVAELGSKFRRLRNLKVSSTTLYEVANYKGDEELAAIISELAKRATRKPLRPREARRVINIGVGRSRFGDHPDATLVKLVELSDSEYWPPWYEEAVAALRERNPDTDESACSLVEELVEQARIKDDAEEIKDDAEEIKDDAEEIEDDAEEDDVGPILDGPPPDLPPPAPGEPQKLDAVTQWAGGNSFVDAVTALLELRTKPAARFAGRFSPSELREVAEFLSAVAVSAERDQSGKAA